eukprot:2270210-Amphidinium_carterae.1
MESLVRVPVLSKQQVFTYSTARHKTVASSEEVALQISRTNVTIPSPIYAPFEKMFRANHFTYADHASERLDTQASRSANAPS